MQDGKAEMHVHLSGLPVGRKHRHSQYICICRVMTSVNASLTYSNDVQGPERAPQFNIAPLSPQKHPVYLWDVIRGNGKLLRHEYGVLPAKHFV